MDENLEFHIKVCKVSSLLGNVVLVCARTKQPKHFFSSLAGLLLWNLHGQNPWPAGWWVLLRPPWSRCSNRILICRTVTCAHTASVCGNTFTNLNFLSSVTKTNLSVHEDKNRVPFVKVRRLSGVLFRCLISLCVSHTSSRLLPLRDALSVLSPAPMRLWMWSTRANLTATLLLPVSPHLTVLLFKHIAYKIYCGYKGIAEQDGNQTKKKKAWQWDLFRRPSWEV